MPIVRISERQFHALMPPALRYQQVLCLRNSEAYVRTLSARYHNQIEIVTPPARVHEPWDTIERIDQMLRVINPQLRRCAILMVFWRGIPRTLLRRVPQVEVLPRG